MKIKCPNCGRKFTIKITKDNKKQLREGKTKWTLKENWFPCPGCGFKVRV